MWFNMISDVENTHRYALEKEEIELLPPYFLSQQRPGLQGFLHLVLLFDGQQGLEELGRLRREDFKGAGVEKLSGAFRDQACVGTFAG